jgi:hypothetical protein
MRKLAAIEALVSASIICTDTPGTRQGLQPYQRSDHLQRQQRVCRQRRPCSHDVAAGLLCSNTNLNQVEDADGNLLWKPKENNSKAPIIVAAGKSAPST